MNEIKVNVVNYPDRKNLVMRYIDPLTQKPVARTAGTSNKRDAERAAAKWEAELREGRYCAPVKTTWEDFREKYENEVTAALAVNTDRKASSVFNSVEAILDPKRVSDLTAERISYFASKLRAAHKSEDTIKSQLSHLRAALSKAVEWGIIPKRPAITMPKRASGAGKAKGRPITGEEFDRMLGKVEAGLLAVSHKPGKRNREPKPSPTPRAVLREQQAALVADSWRYLLRGLWHSGLRLAESLELFWDADDQLCVDLSGKHPILRIPAALEKGHQDRELPMAPEFARFLLDTPQNQRSGPVFNPRAMNDPTARATADAAGRVLSAIGEAAGVVVSKATKGDKSVVKYASAHDLRRSFGDRWASRVMPQVLMELMRHESIETTLKYYVGRNAQTTAAVLWEADKVAGNISGNIAPADPVKSGNMA